MPLAMLVGTFSWSFVYVTLPFYIQRLSVFDGPTTLRWTGWILGVSPLATVLTGPIWGRFAMRRNLKTLYLTVQGLQGLAFLGMALARSLPELFVARLVLGVMGAASTFAFIMAGRAPRTEEVRRQVAWIQGGMTIGQVVGPLLGAVAAAGIGFRGSFVVGALILWGCAALVWWGVPSAPPPQGSAARSGSSAWREVVVVCLIVLGGSSQVLFLTAVLPQILPDLGVSVADMLVVGGLVIFVSGLAAAVGSLMAPRLAAATQEGVTVLWLLVTSSVLMLALIPIRSVWLFGVVRFIQVLCIAPVFPMVVARIAQDAGGAAVGFVNSARIGAAFIGPVVATTVLSWSSTTALYIVLAALGLACAPLALTGGAYGLSRSDRTPPSRPRDRHP